MGSRRFTMTPTSDEEDEPPLPPQRQRKQREEEVEDRSQARGRKRMKLQVDDEEAEEEGSPRSRDEMKKKKKEEEAEPKSEEEGGQEDAIPIGEVMRISGKGKGRRRHYKAFEFDRNCFQLEDPVLIVPEATDQKPYVAVIKDITQTTDGSMMVRGRWFYRPEEAERKGGGSWQSSDTRELFYSFHHDEVPAESVMHKCVVHFVPLHKQLPNRKNYPGFIVQKVYDTVAKRLYKLTDKDYEDELQREIDLLVKKTMARLGSLPDIEAEDPAAEQEQLRSKKTFRKKNITPLDVTRPDDLTAKSDQYLKAETPGICSSNMSEYYKILVMFKAFTGETQRDKWLEKLLQAVQSVCNSSKKEQEGDKGKLIPTRADHTNAMDSTAAAKEAQEKKVTESFVWPDAAVPAVSALERAAHDTLSSDFQKYNQKMRQLVFNLKSNAFLAGRLLNGELEPSRILNMSPVELKEGLTAEETARNEPEESECMQMTDARCKRCMEKKVGLIDIIQAGHGERYQLECIACGNTWYAPRDAVSVLTIDGPSSAKSIGTAPLATAKFEEVEKKKLGSPHDSDKPAADVFKKSTEAYMPVLETQKSFNKPKLEENRGPTKDA